jgi:hypothetical protein
MECVHAYGVAPLPLFFISVNSKEFSFPVTHLESTLTSRDGSIDSKELGICLGCACGKGIRMRGQSSQTPNVRLPNIDITINRYFVKGEIEIVERNQS